MKKAVEVPFILSYRTGGPAYVHRDQILLVMDTTRDMNTMVFNMKKLIETMVKMGWLDV